MHSSLSLLAALAALSFAAADAVGQDTEKRWPDGKTYVSAGEHLFE